MTKLLLQHVSWKYLQPAYGRIGSNNSFHDDESILPKWISYHWISISRVWLPLHWFDWKTIPFKDSHSINLDFCDHFEKQKKKLHFPPNMMFYHTPFNKKKHKKYTNAWGCTSSNGHRYSNNKKKDFAKKKDLIEKTSQIKS